MLNLDIQFSNILQKYDQIEKSLNQSKDFNSEDLIKLNREYADLKPIVEKIYEFKFHKLQQLTQEIVDK